ncbi:fibril protein [Corallococcus sp. AB049A]|uniref:fibril protein n=1 Tax=Corallococcus sp. AB049A TaxID=2316721 RepID=UPI000EA32A82|nr:fibril protein [Corallococcus sp. AB049A]RKH45648.1 fibril protein [Corallococcus sp. AB050B]RKI67918.1 fibril protein [Corallococcus sp. AB049A]
MSLFRFVPAAVLLLTACASPGTSFEEVMHRNAPIQPTRPDPLTYGTRPENPVRVGWGDKGVMAYFKLLRGPQGQPVAWRLMGDCCEFTEVDGQGKSQGRLSIFEVTYEGLDTPVVLYVDAFTGGNVYAPWGFQLEGQGDAPPPSGTEPEIIDL